MKILFSPSEGKNYPAQKTPLSPKISELHKQYLDFVCNADLLKLQKMWGIKKEEELLRLKEQSLLANTARAIECYSGVAYEALDFVSLKQKEQNFILDSVLICSNLFGIVSAKENLPFYKLKQGEGFGEFETKTLYRAMENELDILLEKEFVIDLRAEFYQKLYTIKSHHFTFEFLKNGKRVSHYAKHYRGIVLREIAKNQGINKIEECLEGLKFLGSKEEKSRTILVFAL